MMKINAQYPPRNLRQPEANISFMKSCHSKYAQPVNEEFRKLDIKG